jgi:hypothetical protein
LKDGGARNNTSKMISYGQLFYLSAKTAEKGYLTEQILAFGFK